MSALRLLDLHFGGREHAIGVYLVETDDGLALFDCGPSSTLPALESGLAGEGLELTDVRHLLLSHIHLDHAGASGPLVRGNPSLTVWVSDVGAPHLVDPSRLERSARRLYGDLFDPLWGELAPVPEANVRIATGDVLGWEAFPTVGHASHHVSYLRDGTLLAGDACGVRMPGASLRPPRLAPAGHRRRGVARDGRGDSPAHTRPARAHPLRRPRGCRRAPRPARDRARRAGRPVSRTAWSRTSSWPPPAAISATTPTTTTRSRRSGSRGRGSSATGRRTASRRAGCCRPTSARAPSARSRRRSRAVAA